MLSPETANEIDLDVRFVTSFDVASLALLVFDYFLTLDLEVALIWPSGWSLVKVIFLINRYMPFIDVPLALYHQLYRPQSESSCRSLYISTAWMFILGIGLTEFVLVYRTWALYDNSKPLGVALLIYFLAFWIAICYGLSRFLDSLRFLIDPNFPLPGCIIIDASDHLAFDWILLMVFESGILLLMLNKAYRMYLTSRSTTIFRTVYRDGIMYYVYIYILSLVNLIYIRTQSRALVVVLASLQRVVHSVLTTRLILGLRQEIVDYQRSPRQTPPFSLDDGAILMQELPRSRNNPNIPPPSRVSAVES
ncbi:hypothetical protein BDV98DRAFT_652765 [Pterulicium gracile]|uniref:DUF6533 domain-containing protein n=1 Tax=Pterulicium gracile TaxID=1884261 RepID=A0A5C3QVU1_9AGAR|nr:hypothetical protein BDV98DRAFT_652765 [Pterula gracilis]